MPVLRLLLPFIAGIILRDNIQIPFSLLIVVCGSLFLLLWFIRFYDQVNIHYNCRWLYGLVLNCFILIFSMCLMSKNMQATSFMDHAGKGGFMVARVAEPPLERERRYRVLIEPLEVIRDNSITRTSGRALGWFEKDSLAGMLRAGDRLVIPDRFSEIRNHGNPFEFDYSSYMRIHGVSGEIYVDAGQWFRPEQGIDRSLLTTAGRLREHLLDVLKNNGLRGTEYAVAGALILGYRSEIDQETRHSYAVSGAMHILAVSGLHVGILYLLIHFLLGFIKKIRYYSFVRVIIILIIIWFYALLTGLSPSVTRASTMFSFVAVGVTFRRSANIFNTLASSAFVQLLINPFTLFMVGFQLSYFAVAGIVYYQPVISSLIKFRTMLAEKIWALSTVSLSAQLIIFPLGIYYFNQFPNYFLLTNILAVPLAMIILYLGLVLFLCSFIPVLASVIAFLLNIAISLLNFITGAISHLPLSHTADIVINIPLLMILYGIIILITHYFILKKTWLLQLSILLAIAGLALRSGYMIRTSDQQIFMVYNSGRYSLYSFISGNNNYIVSGREQDFEAGLMPYAASRTALFLNTGNVSVVTVAEMLDCETAGLTRPYYVKGRFVDFNGYRIYFAGSNEAGPQHAPDPVHVDLLVISSEFSSAISDICTKVSPDKVIIDSSVPFYLRAKFIEQCMELELNYHDVRGSGAFTTSVHQVPDV